jgi:hypothetical protein
MSRFPLIIKEVFSPLDRVISVGMREVYENTLNKKPLDKFKAWRASPRLFYLYRKCYRDKYMKFFIR